MYPKMVKHPNGYLVWARLIPAADSVSTDPWRKRLLTDADPGGWYVTISRDGSLFELDGQLISGPYPTLQDAMVVGMAHADHLPVLEPLP